tara:strand:+ start:596 stop:874 length:279 start_codon:yes stop_codon:yes gene_type:complete
MSNIQIQASQENGQAREQQIEGKMTIYLPLVPGLTKSKGHIGVLQGEIELVKGMNDKPANLIMLTDAIKDAKIQLQCEYCVLLRSASYANTI